MDMQNSPLSHSLLQGNGGGMPMPQGGLNQSMPPPPQAAPPAAALQQQGNSALARASQDNTRAMIDSASDSALDPAEALQHMLAMQMQQYSQGLPSMQEAQRAAIAYRPKYLAQLAPEEYSGMDTLAMGLTNINNPRMLERGNTGLALAQMGRGAVAARQGFEDRELAKSKATYDTLREASKPESMGLGSGVMTAMAQAALNPTMNIGGVGVNKITGQTVVPKHLEETFQKYYLAELKIATENREENPQQKARDRAMQMLKSSIADPTVAGSLYAQRDGQAPLPSQGGLPRVQPTTTQADPSAIAAGEAGPDKRSAVEGALAQLSAEDRATVTRLINRMNSNPDTIEADSATIDKIIAKPEYRSKASAFPTATIAASAEPTQYLDKAAEAGKKTAAEERAKTDIAAEKAKQTGIGTRQGNVAPGAPVKLSAGAEKELFETDDAIKVGERTISLLRNALEINDKAYSGYLAKPRAVLRSNLPGESDSADATIDLDNMMTSQALESLKLMFGGMPTEGERKVLLDIQASTDKTPKQRKAIMDRAILAAQTRVDANTQKANTLRSGMYTGANQTSGTTTAITQAPAASDDSKEARYQAWKKAQGAK